MAVQGADRDLELPPADGERERAGVDVAGEGDPKRLPLGHRTEAREVRQLREPPLQPVEGLALAPASPGPEEAVAPERDQLAEAGQHPVDRDRREGAPRRRLAA